VTRIAYRGDYRQPKGAVQPGDLTIAAPEGKRFEIAPKNPKVATSTERRLAFAKHLTAASTRFWGACWSIASGSTTSAGIVNTPGDFGVLGERPSHPELLDWLSLELVRQGWSMKKMHKLIMMSTAYRQSSGAPSPGSR